MVHGAWCVVRLVCAWCVRGALKERLNAN